MSVRRGLRCATCGGTRFSKDEFSDDGVLLCNDCGTQVQGFRNEEDEGDDNAVGMVHKKRWKIKRTRDSEESGEERVADADFLLELQHCLVELAAGAGEDLA